MGASVFRAAQRSHEEPPEDGPDFLDGKPKGLCPWCRSPLHRRLEGGEYLVSCQMDECHEWDEDDTEDENRARYVAEKEAEAAHEERLSREAKRRRGFEP